MKRSNPSLKPRNRAFVIEEEKSREKLRTQQQNKADAACPMENVGNVDIFLFTFTD
jgi:hypothetical protein